MTTVTMMKMITEAARAVPSFGFSPALSGLVVGVLRAAMLKLLLSRQGDKSIRRCFTGK